MDLQSLPKTTRKSQKRVGRGIGSGKGGHTSGRGTKGQKSKESIPLIFAGTKTKKSWIKRLPLARGKGKFKSRQSGPLALNVKYLNLLPQKSAVDIATLAKYGIIDEKEGKEFGVKILGDGDLAISLEVKLPCSKGARKKIEKAGGRVEK